MNTNTRADAVFFAVLFLLVTAMYVEVMPSLYALLERCLLMALGA